MRCIKIEITPPDDDHCYMPGKIGCEFLDEGNICFFHGELPYSKDGTIVFRSKACKDKEV